MRVIVIEKQPNSNTDVIGKCASSVSVRRLHFETMISPKYACVYSSSQLCELGSVSLSIPLTSARTVSLRHARAAVYCAAASTRWFLLAAAAAVWRASMVRMCIFLACRKTEISEAIILFSYFVFMSVRVE